MLSGLKKAKRVAGVVVFFHAIQDMYEFIGEGHGLKASYVTHDASLELWVQPISNKYCVGVHLIGADGQIYAAQYQDNAQS